ncbi:hypothetical protein, partial [Acetobacter aceti]|uniref:hypothetical protein n=1 Tax=Acetobacter aceti TaxID=435 RepID=UPI0011AED214
MTVEISSPGFGNIGNKIIQYMVCKKLNSEISNSIICDICIDDFNIINKKSTINDNNNVIIIGDDMEIPFKRLSEYLSLNKDVKILLNGFFQKIKYYPPLEDCRKIFASDMVLNHHFSDDEVVINIRCGELT